MKYFTSLLLGLSLVACGDKTEDADEDGFTADVDCDDSDSAVTVGNVYLADADGDGFGDAGSPLISCGETAPTGYVANTATPDCDDANADVNPGADEVCSDAIDNDCDGLLDAADDSAETITVYQDADGDGFGSMASAKVCEVEDGWVENSDDCNDANADVNPDATEVCDGIDNDCDADIDIADDSVEGTMTVYADTDGDRFGDADVSTEVCERTDGWVEDNTDCNDAHGAVNPAADEILGDGVDQDCDAQELCYEDLDDDGYGSENHAWIADDGAGVYDCEATANASLNWSDCDDSDAAVNPDAAEVCDSGVDNDCDGLADDADDSLDATTGSMFYADMDGDGYGAAEVWSCEQGSNSDNMDDCDDTLASSNPMATDVVGDGTDQNCDGVDGQDGDADGYASWESGGDDCADADSAINPGAQEVCDSGIDNDCDGLIDDEDDSNDVNGTTMLYADYDWDGFGDANEVFNSCDAVVDGWVADSTDCDDWDEFTYPGAAFAQSATDCLTDYDMDGWSADALGGGNQACYELSMTDSYGDSWNGHAIEVHEDGVLVASYENTDDNSDGGCGIGCEETITAEHCVDDGVLVDFYFIDGSFSSEVSFMVTASDGTVILDSDGSSHSDGELLYSETAVGDGSPALADCDDWDADINPDAAEVCDGWDNNCDGDVDEELLVEMYPDWDMDGFGAETGEWVCEGEMGYVDDWSDCDDTLSSINPEVTDIWGDGIDQNCDGSDGADYDGDGYVSVESGGDDCDDWDEFAHPGASELELDWACTRDADDDGYADADFEADGGWAGTDCDDEDATVNIEGEETYYDGVDQNCDGWSDFDWDQDGDDIDGYDFDGDGVVETEMDFDGDGEIDWMAGGDCDDQDADFNSMVDEIWYDNIDQNCDGWNDFDADMDGELPAEVDCGNDGFMDTECDFDGDGVMEFTGGNDCDDWDANANTLDLDGDGISGCDGDCWDSDEDEDGDGIADSSYTYPGVAFNEPNFEDCLTDYDGDGYAGMGREICLDFILHDTYGDGWNGNELHVYEENQDGPNMTGVLVNENLDESTGSTLGGETQEETFCLAPDTMQWGLMFIEGSFSSEVQFEIYDSNGDFIFEGVGSDFSDGDMIYGEETGNNPGSDCDDWDADVHPDADQDEDGYFACGDDCDDNDPDVNPGADMDEDGFFACGEDCDDNDADIYPGADEIYYNGMSESTCEPHNDYDWDGDGDWVAEIDCLGDGNFASECDFDGDGEIDWMGGTDCDDEDPDVHGLDYDWDGVSSCDGDCDDWNEWMFPGNEEIWYDGMDGDCAGDSDWDQDGDGLDNANYGGDDCDDFHANVGATDVDGDGYLDCLGDCNTDVNNGGADQFPGNPEICEDGIDQDCDGIDQVCAQPSCADHYDAGGTADGIYLLLDDDGNVYDAYCDMNSGVGGWTRVVGTDSTSHDFGQETSDIVSAYVPAGDTVGVAEAFMKVTDFSEVMIKKTSGTFAGEYAAYNLVESSNGMSVLDILYVCRDQTRAYGDDSAWDGARLIGYTSAYSGTIYDGGLTIGNGDTPDYFFMCGVNESSDNDQSVMAFSDSPGDNNNWGDGWRHEGQNGTLWSFWNGDYHSGTYHIGNGYGQANAGYRTDHGDTAGSYEVYVR